MISLPADLGIKRTARIHVVASAALGILERRGVDRVRYLDVGALWLHEQALRMAVEFLKVKDTSKPADLMTKHLAREQVEQYAEALKLDCREGHADTAAKALGDPHETRRRAQHRQRQQRPTRRRQTD